MTRISDWHMTYRLLCLSLVTAVAACKADVSQFQVVPFPASVSPRSGQFVFDENITVTVSDPTNGELTRIAQQGAEMLGTQLGTAVSVAPGPAVPGDNVIGLFLIEEGGRPETYRLVVDSTAIRLEAETTAGLYYGLQTLRQLPRRADESSSLVGYGETWFIPAVQIEDSPRFTYRGMHLDVGRHFMPAEFIKRYIDIMAMYKMNTFHWHLTEDQGWRIEIQKYPRLTEVGAYTRGDSGCSRVRGRAVCHHNP